MQIKSINNIKFGQWETPREGEKFLNELLKQKDKVVPSSISNYKDLSSEDKEKLIKRMYNTISLADCFQYNYRHDSNEDIFEVFDGLSRYKRLNPVSTSLIDALYNEYNRIVNFCKDCTLSQK